jgi:hypothetical protein
MKSGERVATRYILAKYKKGNITIKVSERYVNRNANLGVELEVDGEYMGHCEALINTYTLEEMGKGHFACADDIEKLSEEYWFEDEMFRYDSNKDEPVVLVVEVIDSDLDESLQGQKCGVQMYVQLVREAFLENGKLPLLFMPNYCHNRSTSDKALRVWKSFAKKYHSEGDVIVIDKTPYL